VCVCVIRCVCVIILVETCVGDPILAAASVCMCVAGVCVCVRSNVCSGVCVSVQRSMDGGRKREKNMLPFSGLRCDCRCCEIV